MVYIAPGKAPAFDKEIISTLANDFSISDSQKKEFSDVLEDAHSRWEWAQEMAAKKHKPSEIRLALVNVEKTALALKDVLATLPEVAIKEIDRISQTDYVRNLENPDYPSISLPALALRDPVASDSGSLIILDHEDWIQIAAALAITSKRALENVPHGKSGRKEEGALDYWIAIIAFYWTGTLNRKFSRDATDDGQPLSEAARFCVEAFSAVDPEVPQSRVLNAMKLYIKNKQ